MFTNTNIEMTAYRVLKETFTIGIVKTLNAAWNTIFFSKIFVFVIKWIAAIDFGRFNDQLSEYKHWFCQDNQQDHGNFHCEYDKNAIVYDLEKRYWRISCFCETRM